MIDREAISDAVVSILAAIGEDPKREGLVDTPRRIAEMYAELFAGVRQDPADVLATGFEEGHREMVVLKGIPFFSVCEHHFLPFIGTAGIGYVPNGRVVGASKLVRALDILARRPQLQERLANQLVDTIDETLRPDGVAAILSAEHMCMALRGVKKTGARIVTSSSRGVLKSDESAKREFLNMLKDAP